MGKYIIKPIFENIRYKYSEDGLTQCEITYSLKINLNHVSKFTMLFNKACISVLGSPIIDSFVAVGRSRCSDKKEYDVKKGQDIARCRAKQKVYERIQRITQIARKELGEMSVLICMYDMEKRINCERQFESRLINGLPPVFPPNVVIGDALFEHEKTTRRKGRVYVSYKCVDKMYNSITFTGMSDDDVLENLNAVAKAAK